MNWDSILFKASELNYVELFFRATILYFVLFLSARVIGYRQPGIVTPYNFIMAAGVSHIAAARMVNPESRPIDAISVIVLYTLLNILLSVLYLKSYNLVSQKPVLIVEHGKVLKENLSKTNLNIYNLMSALRLKNAFSIKNVSYAFAEPVGEISVCINLNHAPPSKNMLNIIASHEVLPEVIIYKGKLDENVMQTNMLDFKWLRMELHKNGYEAVDDIYLGILESDKTLYLQK